MSQSTVPAYITSLIRIRAIPGVINAGAVSRIPLIDSGQAVASRCGYTPQYAGLQQLYLMV